MTESDPVVLQSEATRKMALDALDELKAENVAVLDVRQVASFTDYMIFASGNSTPATRCRIQHSTSAKYKGAPRLT